MTVGRPLKFSSPEELQKKIDSYFEECKANRDLVTITGLALFLDTSRETLMDYQERDGYSDAVKKAKLRVEMEYEKSLRINGRSGDIFALKNFGWRDKQETEIAGRDGGPIVVVSSQKDKDLLEKI